MDLDWLLKDSKYHLVEQLGTNIFRIKPAERSRECEEEFLKIVERAEAQFRTRRDRAQALKHQGFIRAGHGRHRTSRSYALKLKTCRVAPAGRTWVVAARPCPDIASAKSLTPSKAQVWARRCAELGLGGLGPAHAGNPTCLSVRSSTVYSVLTAKNDLSLPKIISGRIGDAGHRGPEQRRCCRTAALLDVTVHPFVR